MGEVMIGSPPLRQAVLLRFQGARARVPRLNKPLISHMRCPRAKTHGCADIFCLPLLPVERVGRATNDCLSRGRVTIPKSLLLRAYKNNHPRSRIQKTPT